MDFVFVEQIEDGVTARYRRHLGLEAIVICPKTILECDKITDDEKTIVITWQIEHEILHATLYNVVGEGACEGLDKTKIYISSVCGLKELQEIVNKIGWEYRQ